MYRDPRPSFHIQGLDAPFPYKLLLSHLGGKGNIYLLKNPRVLLALVHILMIWVFHFKAFAILAPRYLILSTFSNTVPSRV